MLTVVSSFQSSNFQFFLLNEKQVLSSRTTIAECEHKMTAKQTEAMYFRDLANSDVRFFPSTFYFFHDVSDFDFFI